MSARCLKGQSRQVGLVPLLLHNARLHAQSQGTREVYSCAQGTKQHFENNIRSAYVTVSRLLVDIALLGVFLKDWQYRDFPQSFSRRIQAPQEGLRCGYIGYIV